jgi:DNA sulfur modification protein DndD
MLLKSIKVKDFRQFKGEQYVSFSTDPEKNVTIILGDNGTGKTTFAQAFRWCLYGDTDFSDQTMLSKAISDSMLPGDEHTVQVDICLVHNSTEYTVTRRLKYRKDVTNKIAKVGNSSFFISYKQSDGNTHYIDELETTLKMKEILPADLSRYFFFDGEHIDKMAKDIRSGRSSDFADAVRSLLGLNAFIATLAHLKNNGKSSVIGRYNESYNAGTDQTLANLIKNIDAYNDKIDAIDKRLNELNQSDVFLDEKCQKLRFRIEANHDSQALAQERGNVQRELEGLEVTKKSKLGLLLKNFNDNAPRYFSKKMIKNSLELLKNSGQLDQGIPDITAKTIDYLLKRGTCLCGHKIEIGDEEYNALNRLRDYIPPKSIGSLIADFHAGCKERITSTSNFADNFQDIVNSICTYEMNRNNLEDRLKKITEKLRGMENVGSLQQELSAYEHDLRQNAEERDLLNQEKGVAQSNLQKDEEKRSNLAIGDANNRKIETYRAYAEYIYNRLKDEYEQKETETRNKLAQTVNEIFKSIYDGGFSLALDAKYNILLTADARSRNYDEDNIETSTAQSISIIFAFIAGVIKLAKENQGQDNRLAQTEPYPLVMDAPLSAFDTKRIDTICDVLPNIAEQVIIFIKDTDGKLADENLGSKIGKRYSFKRKTVFETELEEISHV